MLMMAKAAAGLFGGGGGAGPDLSAYTAALTAIPNKTFHVRGDTSTAANGNSLTTTPWDNEYGADVTGAPTWQTASLNSYRGVAATGTQSGASTDTLSAILPSGAQFTIFFVAKYNGTQGADTFATFNSCVIRDSNQIWGVGFVSNSNQLAIRSGSGAGNQWNTGRLFTDNTPFACAIKINSSGSNGRILFNGSASAGTSIGLTTPANKSGTLAPVAQNANSGVIYEILCSSDELSDAQMDSFDLLLRQKWGLAP